MEMVKEEHKSLSHCPGNRYPGRLPDVCWMYLVSKKETQAELNHWHFERNFFQSHNSASVDRL